MGKAREDLTEADKAVIKHLNVATMEIAYALEYAKWLTRSEMMLLLKAKEFANEVADKVWRKPVEERW